MLPQLSSYSPSSLSVLSLKMQSCNYVFHVNYWLARLSRYEIGFIAELEHVDRSVRKCIRTATQTYFYGRIEEIVRHLSEISIKNSGQQCTTRIDGSKTGLKS